MTLALRIDDFNSRAVTRQRHLPDQPFRDRSDMLHSSVPSVPNEIGMDQQEMTKDLRVKTFRERLPIDEIDERDLADIVGQRLRSDYGHVSSKHKAIARDARAASPKSAENWTAGNNVPSLLYFLRLYARSPALQGEVRRLCALDADLSPEFQAEFMNLVQRMGV